MRLFFGEVARLMVRPRREAVELLAGRPRTFERMVL
jgi:hypothetical protein